MNILQPRKTTQKSSQASERGMASDKLVLLFKIHVKVFDKIVFIYICNSL